MMYKKKTPLKRRLFALALIPAIGAGIAVTSIPSVAGVLESLGMTSVSIPSSAPVEDNQKSPVEREIYTEVETQPEYPGGISALMNFLANNIKYPEDAYKANEQGRVIVKFVVEKDGSLGNFEIEKGVAESLNKEAVRVLKEMPKWTPGKVNNQPVACYYTLPVSFRL